jgi:Family of unknown function (DUF5694)
MIFRKLLISICISVVAVNFVFSQAKIFNPDDILIGKTKQPQVLLVGTFHFQYFNLDVVKTAADKQVNILSPQKQKEVQELVNYIARFKPTKIIIEGEPGDTTWGNRYTRYLAGKKILGKNEIEQLGFRLAKQFKLDTLYGADAANIYDDLFMSKDSIALRPTLLNIFSGWGNDYKYKCDKEICKRYDSLSKYDEELNLKSTLLSYFKFLNTDKSLARNYGSYFNGDYFEQGDTRGADALAMDWYNRNLRIYRNIQKATTSPNDRILVLFGQGHVAILKQLFESDPVYKLVKFNELNNLKF